VLHAKLAALLIAQSVRLVDLSLISAYCNHFA